MATSESVVRFLHRWMNDPIPPHILAAGAEIMAMEEYEPERRVHQIVTKCIMLAMEHEHGADALSRPAPEQSEEGE